MILADGLPGDDPLASPPALSRLENSVTIPALSAPVKFQ